MGKVLAGRTEGDAAKLAKPLIPASTSKAVNSRETAKPPVPQHSYELQASSVPDAPAEAATNIVGSCNSLVADIAFRVAQRLDDHRLDALPVELTKATGQVTE